MKAAPVLGCGFFYKKYSKKYFAVTERHFTFTVLNTTTCKHLQN